ncbi:MAG TPA: histidine phosphatase family protein [Microlunatus sp.]|nr:histidine phosphatase family protein [Microlunatus sp.]
MTAAQLVVLRHGRTSWNATGRFQGQADIPLDERGRLQAEQAAAVLAELAPTAIHSSDLVRARATAEPLARACGLPVVTDPRLREIHVGTWEGLTIDELFTQVDDDLKRAWLAGEDVRRSETGETVAEVGERAGTALDEIGHAAPDGSTVVAVMHGLAARAGVCHLLGIPTSSWKRLSGLHNCGWIIVQRHPTGDFWRVTEFNVTAPRR